MGTPDNLADNRDAPAQHRSLGLGNGAGVSVVSYGDEVHALTGITDNAVSNVDAIKDLGANQGGKRRMWDGVAHGLADLSDLPGSHQPTIVLITDGVRHRVHLVGERHPGPPGADRGRVVRGRARRPARTGPLRPELARGGVRRLGRSTASKPADVARAMGDLQSTLDHRT